MKTTVTCNDCQIVWDYHCYICKDNSPCQRPRTGFCHSVPIIKRPIKSKDSKVLKDSFLGRTRRIVSLDRVIKVSVFSDKVIGESGVCFYCQKEATTYDHFYPVSRLGKLVVPCCRLCNQEKGNSHPTHWLDYVQYNLKNDIGAENIKTLRAKIHNLPSFDQVEIYKYGDHL